MHIVLKIRELVLYRDIFESIISANGLYTCIFCYYEK